MDTKEEALEKCLDKVRKIILKKGEPKGTHTCLVHDVMDLEHFVFAGEMFTYESPIKPYMVDVWDGKEEFFHRKETIGKENEFGDLICWGEDEIPERWSMWRVVKDSEFTIPFETGAE